MKNTSELLSVVAANKLIWLLVFGIFIVSLSSCEVDEIPEVDNDPPEFTLTIQGPGVNHTFTQRDDFDRQLNLLKDAIYDFTFLGADTGGVELLVLFAPHAFMDFSDLESGVIREENEFRTLLRKEGDSSNPLTALSMTGKMEMGAEANVGFTLSLEVHDFASPANSTYADLSIQIVEDSDMVGF
ncbi:MAG: hypothetical protein ABJH05_06040 [Fulvivirga sp.]